MSVIPGLLPPPTRVIVCGSRNWTDRKRIAERLFDLSLETEGIDCVIVHGLARGADRIADQEAERLGFQVERHPAKWNEHGDDCNCPPGKEMCKAAGPRRNKLMASLDADLCIAFWDGASSGTEDMMKVAKRNGIPVEKIMSTDSDLRTR